MKRLNEIIASGLTDIGNLYDKLGDGRKFTYWKASKSIRGIKMESIQDLLQAYSEHQLANVGDAIISKAIDFAEGRIPNKMRELQEQVEVMNASKSNTNPHKHYMTAFVAKVLVNKYIFSCSPSIQCVPSYLCGSFRRGKSIVGDIDVLVPADEPFLVQQIVDEVENGCASEGLKIKVTAKGERKAKFVLQGNDEKDLLEVDLYVCPKNELASHLLYFTGSQSNNIMMRAEAKKRGYSLSEHGLRNLQTQEYLRFETERDYYEFLGLRYLEPNER